MSSEVKFSQSAAVTRCRNVKELKLKAQQALAKLADEEVTVYTANLEGARHQLQTQLVEDAAIVTRQLAQAADTKISWVRKEQLNALVDKLTAIKSLLRFQEEAREREIGFKSSIRQKRSAFQARSARLEQRHASERNELLMSQQRLATTVSQIRAIEIKGIKDKNKARRIQRENEIQAQQTSMRQQKESEFLRELQLCKVRQAAEINDLEIMNMEELEDVVTQQRLEEFELLNKQAGVESEMQSSIENQKFKLEAEQLAEKQQSTQQRLQRMQKKQSLALAKSQRAASRARERMLISDNPIIRDSGNSTDYDKDNGIDDQSASASDSQSEGTSRSGGSVLSLHAAEQQQQNADGNNAASDKDAEGSESELAQKTEAEANSRLNRNTQVMTEGEKEIQAVVESGNERLRGIIMHHKKLLAELRQHHRALVNQKVKEQRRKMGDMLKDHEEQLEQLKMDQAASMKDLLETQMQNEEMRADTAVSQNLLGMMLPAHIMEKIEADIYGFKKLVGEVSPVKILELLNLLYSKFDAVIAKYPQLYKVESVSDTYMVAAGLSAKEASQQDLMESTTQALSCCMELQELVNKTDFSHIVGSSRIELRIGIHSGTINAGLIGTKMSRYCLFGDTVNTASRMCTTGEAGKIQVSPQTIEVLGEDDSFEFEVRGEIEVKGKGKMRTYFLLY